MKKENPENAEWAKEWKKMFPDGVQNKTAMDFIADERMEQMWKHKHDIWHDIKLYADNNELEMAAIAYAMPEHIQQERGVTFTNREDYWPWNKSSYKPHPENRIKELVKAACLLIAKIDVEIAKNIDFKK